ncbi:MAG: hypothetical protein ACRDNB_10340 [Gaiellaceae bacterium]
MDAELSQGLAVAYGALGGLVAWVVLFALPELRTLNEVFRDPGAPNPRPRTYVILGLIAVCLVFPASIVPFAAEASDAREALLYGVTAEAFFAGIAKAATGI